MLFIKHLLDTLMNANIMEASFVRSVNGDVTIYTPTTNYSCHPNSLEHLSFYEFTSIYKKIASIKQLPFKEPHPQWASHSLKAQTFKFIINVSRAQLLDISWKDLAPKKHFSYFQTLLTLHKLFCYINDLLGNHISWQHTFQSHNQFIAMQAYIEHCELAHIIIMCGTDHESEILLDHPYDTNYLAPNAPYYNNDEYSEDDPNENQQFDFDNDMENPNLS